MQKPLVVSYYTKNTPYEQHKSVLVDSCKKHNIDYDIVGIDDQGLWSKNCCYKPKLLREKLQEHKRPLIWTDIDSIFLQKPLFFDTCQEDFAIYTNKKYDITDKRRVFAGTFFMRPTEAVDRLLEQWEQECIKQLKKDSQTWDQACLRDVLLQSSVKQGDLPLEYALSISVEMDPLLYKKISYDSLVQRVLESKSLKMRVNDVVIIHYQISRLYAGVIDKDTNKMQGSELYQWIVGEDVDLTKQDQAQKQELKGRLCDKLEEDEIHENFLMNFMQEDQGS